jgi:hypothetical protein
MPPAGCRHGWRKHSAAQKQLLLEVATAGQKGLKINAPDARLQLRHLPNSKPITALQAAWLLFVGVKLLLPGQEAGFDVEREFAVARGMVTVQEGPKGWDESGWWQSCSSLLQPLKHSILRFLVKFY